jgi:hypothetical protein
MFHVKRGAMVPGTLIFVPDLVFHVKRTITTRVRGSFRTGSV